MSATTSKTEKAAKLAAELRRTADDLESAVHGDRQAAQRVLDRTDNYWHGLVFGPSEIEGLVEQDDDDE